MIARRYDKNCDGLIRSIQREISVDDLIELYVLGNAGQSVAVYSGLLRNLTAMHFRDVSNVILLLIDRETAFMLIVITYAYVCI
jgi:hypothetical protein